MQNWCSLETLHEHIQNAMGWADTHPHHFVIDGILYGSSIGAGRHLQGAALLADVDDVPQGRPPEGRLTVPVRVRV